MKIKLVTVDLEWSRKQKRWAAAAVAACAAAIAGSVAIASVPVTFTAGETLTAADLNKDFDDLDTRVGGLDQRLAKLEAAKPNVVTATRATGFVTSSVTFVDIPGLTVDITSAGGPLLVAVTANINVFGGTAPPGGYGRWGMVTVLRDGVDLSGGAGFQEAAAGNQDNVPIAFTFVDKPPAGMHTYKVQVRNGEAGYSIEMGEGNQVEAISVAELK